MKKKIIIKAMNAHVGTSALLRDPRYLFEPKLDGIRALCYVNTSMHFISRNDLDLTGNYPEFNFRKAIKARSAILDGEIVAYDKDGHPSFAELQTGAKAYYVVFDVLMKNGKTLINLPLLERKKILAHMIKKSGRLDSVPFAEDGKTLWKEIKKYHLEGVVAKEINGTYHPGVRSHTWLKIKATKTIDCVIVGFSQERRLVSALALGMYDKHGTLHYIGNVGTGFNETSMRELYRKLLPLKQDEPACVDVEIKGKLKKIQWVKPTLVAEVEYLQFTQYAMLRASVFLRLRVDKKSRQCTFESQLERIALRSIQFKKSR